MERDNNYNQSNRLQELGGSDFEIVDNQPNIKGWSVKNPQGQTIGEVDELIFDVQSRKVRYMVVDLENSVLDLEPRDVLVPIGLAELHESDDEVIIPNVTVEQLRALPVYEKGKIGRDTEAAIRSIFGGLGVVGAATTSAMASGGQEDFYDHHHFNEGNLNQNRRTSTDADYLSPATDKNMTEGETAIPIIEEDLQVGKEQVQTGGARLTSRIVEEEVAENLTLRKEHITVERTPVNRPVSPVDINAFQEETIELTEQAEVPVVNKEARVVEEITLEKEVTEHDEVIRDTLRSTKVDVENVNADANHRRTNEDTSLTDEERNRPTNL